MREKPDPKDPQRETVYDWERRRVLFHMPAMTLSDEEVVQLVHAAAWIAECPRPTVEFCPLEVPCLAIPKANRIRISDWGRNVVVVLHEMAHISSWPAVRDGEAGHGPAFVGQAIMLYSNFSPLTEDYLQETARRDGVSFRTFRSRRSFR